MIVEKQERLTQAEETILFNKFKKGDEEAKKILIERNIPLVYYLLGRQRVKKTEVDDVVQTAIVHMLQGIKNFDPEKDVRLGSYLTAWINRGITVELRKSKGPITIPRHLDAIYGNIKHYLRNGDLTKEHKKEIIKRYKTTETTIDSILRSIRYIDNSADKQTPDFIDTAPINDAGFTKVEDKELELKIEKIYKEKLSEKEYYILQKRYYEGQTYKTIADTLGTSRQRIEQIANGSLRRKLGNNPKLKKLIKLKLNRS